MTHFQPHRFPGDHGSGRVLLFGLILLILSPAAAELKRTFHNKKGQIIEAEVLKLHPGNLLEIRRETDGRVFKIAVTDLSLEDQQFLGENRGALMTLGGAAFMTPFQERGIDLGTAAPGRLELTGDLAFPLVVSTGDPDFVVGAASIVGKGKAIAFSHSDFCIAMPQEDRGCRKLFLNSLRWLAGKERPRVVLYQRSEKLKDLLDSEDIPVVSLELSRVTNSNCDAVILSGNLAYPSEVLDALKRFVSEGGGILIGSVPWASASRYKDFATDFPPNQLIGGGDMIFLSKGLLKPEVVRIVEGNPIVLVDE